MSDDRARQLDALVEAIAAELRQREDLLDKLAPLWARHGQSGTASLVKQQRLAAINFQLRQDGEFRTEQQAKEFAALDPAYRALIDELDAEREHYKRIQGRLESSSRRLDVLLIRLRLAGIPAAVMSFADESADDDSQDIG
jgi:hypothetical protein